MSNFRTEILLKKANQNIRHQDKVMMLGSCFSENMGDKMQQYKFDALSNPMGILYNPESIAQSIDYILEQKVFTEDDLFEKDGLWHSFAHHSRFSNAHKGQMLEQINEQLKQAHEYLSNSSYLILTFGTSWLYEHITNEEIVANCHKLPAKTFKRYRLSLSGILDRYQDLLERLRSLNPNIKIILTVSPIRHLKDGFQENQLSKSTLILACHQMTQMLGDCEYFPSYEMMMDDLRDYRFYAEDMVHPSSLAIDYIWEQFAKVWIAPNASKQFSNIEKINKAVQHRPFNPKTEAHQQFLKKQLELINQLKKENQGLNLTKEIDFLSQQIIS